MEGGNRGIFWIRFEGEERLATENLVPGRRAYKENLVVRKGVEYRLWDPFRSKLAAAVMKGLEEFPFAEGSSVLYLGVSTGTTASHISDIVGPGGTVFGVDHASRVAREFIDRVASRRRNVIPIVQDARKPKEYSGAFGKVDVVYVDIAQPDQTAIAIENCRAYLKKNGWLFLVVKPRSINVAEAPGRVIAREVDKLRAGFEILQVIDLRPYDKDHAIALARALG